LKINPVIRRRAGWPPALALLLLNGVVRLEAQPRIIHPASVIATAPFTVTEQRARGRVPPKASRPAAPVTGFLERAAAAANAKQFAVALRLLREARTANAPERGIAAVQERTLTAGLAEATRLFDANRFASLDALLRLFESNGIRSPGVQRMRAALEAAAIERRAFKDLLERRYERVISTTEAAFAAGVRTQRLLYFSACANAALDLLDGTFSRAVVARKQFAEATAGIPRPTFEQENRYISERIRRAAEGGR
jgi:hypothetical protein